MSHRTELDGAFVRARFPALEQCAFLENAGGTRVPYSVIERVRAYMTETQVQPGADFAPSALAAERIARAHAQMAEMINAAPEELMVGISTTMNVYLLAQALRPLLAPGDEVVVTDLDHEANNGAWRRLAEHGVVVREWRVARASAALDPADLEALLGACTRLVCFTACSNITGALHDVAAICAQAHAAGALACVDAVALAAHRALDVRALDCDFLLLSPYKLYGPHLGLLYGRREHLLAARGQNHYFFGEDEIPIKLNPGGPNHELTAGLSGIVDYFDALHGHHFPGSSAGLRRRFAECFELFAAHEERLAAPLVEFLRERPGVRIIGPESADRGVRVPTFSFVSERRAAAEVAAHCARRGVGIRSGDFYARRLIDALGLGEQGVIRASMVHYNSAEEVERLIAALDEVL